MPPEPWDRRQSAPNISIQINVNARQLGPSDFEVSLMWKAERVGAVRCFKFELNYSAGSGWKTFLPTRFSRWS